MAEIIDNVAVARRILVLPDPWEIVNSQIIAAVGRIKADAPEMEQAAYRVQCREAALDAIKRFFMDPPGMIVHRKYYLGGKATCSHCGQPVIINQFLHVTRVRYPEFLSFTVSLGGGLGFDYMPMPKDAKTFWWPISPAVLHMLVEHHSLRGYLQQGGMVEATQKDIDIIAALLDEA